MVSQKGIVEMSFENDFCLKQGRDGMIIGYARVSTQDQDLSLQLDALERAKCERVFKDTESGARTKREGLDDALAQLRKEDVFVVYKLDRLGRSVRSLVNWVKELEEQGIQFRSLTENIDTTTPQGRFFFHIMASLAEMERDLIRERTKAGLAAARKRGRIGGRKPKMTESKKAAAKKLFDSDVPPRDIARDLGVSVATLYRWLTASERTQ